MKARASLLACACVIACVGVPAWAAPADEAKAILDAAGVKGGVVVHLGCGDGKLTAALRANNSFLVHGLDADTANVAASRKHIRSLGLYGSVSVEAFDGKRLPYVDDLVNLVVAEDLGGVSTDEVMRTLRPGGVVCIKQNGRWTPSRKPWPKDIDEWSHYLHDASNNAVARDTVVASPRRMKWTCGPTWSRSHEYRSSIPAMVSAGGRIYTVVDEGLTSLTSLPSRWTLVARDAFNGVLLWKQPLPNWQDGWKSSALRGRPASMPRRIVADGKSLYVTRSFADGLSILDGATGEMIRTVKGTENTQEIALVGRTLLLRLTGGAAARGKATGAIAAVDADRGKILWRVNAKTYLALSLAADDGRVVYNTGTETVCLGLADGREKWRTRAAGKGRTFILHGDVVLEGGGTIVARDAATGKARWTAKPGGGKAMRGEDLFVAQGCVWHATSGGIAGYDLKTGKQAQLIDPSSVDTPGHHLRCYRAKATERFLITQFRGAEFVSLTGGDHYNNDWIRGPCSFGIMPCNGLLYVPPNPCFCYPGVKVTGFNALAGLPAKGTFPKATGPRLEKGPAFGTIDNPPPPRLRRTGRQSTIPPTGRRIGMTGGGRGRRRALFPRGPLRLGRWS
jgi:outer membrane protein assembly factor BamB